jgi:hypothetical protein
VRTHRERIEAEIARQQDEHTHFLDAKLRRSDLDLKSISAPRGAGH